MVERYVAKCDGLPAGFAGVAAYRYSPDKYKAWDGVMAIVHWMLWGGLVAAVFRGFGPGIGAVEFGIIALSFLGNVYVLTRFSVLNSRVLSGFMLHLNVEENPGPKRPQVLNFYFGDATYDDWVAINREQEERSRLVENVRSNVA